MHRIDSAGTAMPIVSGSPQRDGGRPSAGGSSATANEETSAPQPLRLSVIIPARNEAATLGAALERVQSESPWELIVVDGGSTDRTAEISRAYGATVISSPAGRGVQMNAGADIATGDVLLFLHADTLLPRGFGRQVVNVLAGRNVAAGAFRLCIDAPGLRFRAIEHAVRWRSALLQLPYGDQGIFLKADTFKRLGRYREWPVMEDFELVRRLRRCGRIAIAPLPVTTSARRWLSGGTWRTTSANVLCVAAYMLGISTDRIAKWRSGDDSSRS